VSRPPVAILCGGRGTRLQEHSREIPKPLVEIGGKPIVWHVIQLYAAQGFDRFLLATGYKGRLIERFATDEPWPPGVRVECVETGLDTHTGGRLKLLEPRLDGAERFCATYSDGLADIDLDGLLRFHASHGALATMTVARPELPFGVTELDEDGLVTGFREKPTSEHWVNGGFFCFEAGVLGYLRRDSVLERAPLEELARDGELRAHRHHGFWGCMDTYKDAVALDDMWRSDVAPWHVWDGSGVGRVASGELHEAANGPIGT
jgi:glucose-1-phosphate cytidylyltransferase